MNNNAMEIFFGSNDKYAQHLAVTITSIIKNANENDRFNFYVLDSGILPENKDRIEKLKEIRDFNIEFIHVDYIEGVSQYLHISKDSFSRIKIPDLFPNLDKALYLDCDIVVLDSLKVSSPHSLVQV